MSYQTYYWVEMHAIYDCTPICLLRWFVVEPIPWVTKEPSIIDEKGVNDGMCYVLHCVRKEHPIVKFKGKVSPMSSFAPTINDRGVLIRIY
jgi:hypothetical protein